MHSRHCLNFGISSLRVQSNMLGCMAVAYLKVHESIGTMSEPLVRNDRFGACLDFMTLLLHDPPLAHMGTGKRCLGQRKGGRPRYTMACCLSSCFTRTFQATHTLCWDTHQPHTGCLGELRFCLDQVDFTFSRRPPATQRSHFREC